MKIKGIKLKDYTLFSTTAGERTLTPARRRKVKERQGYKCAHCHKKFPEWQLQVHHKKEVHKHKQPFVNLPEISFGKKIIPRYDRRSNLEAVCIPCHNKTKSKKKATNRATKKKATKKRTTKKRIKKKQRACIPDFTRY